MRSTAVMAVFMVSLTMAITGCTGNISSSQSATATLSGDYAIRDSLNATGDIIGKRAVMQMSKSDAKAMSAKEFSKLVDKETAAADTDGADYLTVDFGDGTGLVFPSCSAEFFFCGKLDSEGMMAVKCETYRYSKKTWARDRER